MHAQTSTSSAAADIEFFIGSNVRFRPFATKTGLSAIDNLVAVHHITHCGNAVRRSESRIMDIHLRSLGD